MFGKKLIKVKNKTIIGLKFFLCFSLTLCFIVKNKTIIGLKYDMLKVSDFLNGVVKNKTIIGLK